MTRDYDINDLAAEYVLGTLDATERAEVETRRAAEPALDAAIAAIGADLAPLEQLVDEVTPPAAIRERLLATVARLPQAGFGIAATSDPLLVPGSTDRGVAKSAVETDIGAIRPADDGGFAETDATDVIVSLAAARRQIAGLEARLSRWRSLAAGVATMAAGLAGLVAYRETLTKAVPQAQPQTFVAVLQKDAQSPAFLMTVDIANRVFTVRPVAAKQQPGKAYELWIIHEKIGPPKSLGVIADDAPRAGVSLAAFEPSAIHGATYAITVEPQGGSPTGAPTSAPVFVGKLIPAGLTAQ